MSSKYSIFLPFRERSHQEKVTILVRTERTQQQNPQDLTRMLLSGTDTVMVDQTSAMSILFSPFLELCDTADDSVGCVF